MVCLLNKSFQPYTRSKKSIVDFSLDGARGKEKKSIASSQAVLASHICRATFAYRTFPCQGQIFPHQTFAYHKKQTFAYQFRFARSRHVPIRNSTQGTFAYQTIAYQKGIENLKKQTFANLKLFIRRDIRL